MQTSPKCSGTHFCVECQLLNGLLGARWVPRVARLAKTDWVALRLVGDHTVLKGNTLCVGSKLNARV